MNSCVDMVDVKSWLLQLAASPALEEDWQSFYHQLDQSGLRFDSATLQKLGLMDATSDRSELQQTVDLLCNLQVFERVQQWIEQAADALFVVPVRVVIMPLHPASEYVIQRLDGVMAHTDFHQTIFFYLSPSEDPAFLKMLESTCYHEYQHVVRNLLSPSREKKRLIDLVVDEGLSEVFVATCLGEDRIGPWSRPQGNGSYEDMWGYVKCHLLETDVYLLNKIMQGDVELKIPRWCGYQAGYSLCMSYLKNKQPNELAELVFQDAWDVYRLIQISGEFE